MANLAPSPRLKLRAELLSLYSVSPHSLPLSPSPRRPQSVKQYTSISSAKPSGYRTYHSLSHYRQFYCSRTVSVFCVLMTQSAAVISLYSLTISHVMEVMRVLCDVRTQILRVGSLMWESAQVRAIGQLDSCRILTAEAGVLPQSRTCEIYGG